MSPEICSLTMSDSQKLKSILLFGPPGAGKGTQGTILDAVPGFFHMSVGDVFRAIDADSADGQEIRQYTSVGKLVPDAVTIEIWKKALDAHIAAADFKPAEEVLILDGMPRNVAQTELVAKYVEVRKIINLKCDDLDEMVNRIKHRAICENRTDDACEDIIRQRFEVYREQTQPVLEQYSADQIVNVEAVGSPAEVLERVLKVAIPVQNENLMLKS